LGDDFSHDLADLVPDCLGIDVVVVDLVGGGYSIVVANRPVIITKLTSNWFFQNYSIAHELGHLTSNSVCDQTQSDNAERTANLFAAELLMPESAIQSIDWESISLADLADRVWHWGTSTQALRTRLKALKLPQRSDVLEVLDGKTQSLLRRHWSKPPGPDLITQRMKRASERRFPTGLLSELEKAVVQGRAPVASLAFALGIDEDDLELDLSADTLTPDDTRLLEGLS